MKILLDENLPHRLGPMISGHEVFTVTFMGWNGIENGELLALAAANKFDVLLTKDTEIPHQQHAKTIPCSIVILQAASNSLEDVSPLIPELLRALPTIKPRAVTYIR